MLHLLQPIWLLASAGILIPVAIHLWNVRKGKTLKIGSIELLERTAQQRARSLRLTELFLLLLRCLLILLLALLLAKPYWQNTAKQKGWIVMDKGNAKEAYPAYKRLVDSLSQAGYTFHWFEKGFAGTDLAKISTLQKDTATREVISYWHLVKMLDEQLLPGMPVYLFTGNRLVNFTGGRPSVHRALTWKTVSRKDSVHTFIAGAYKSDNDSIVIRIGESMAAGTHYHLQTLAMDKPRQNDFTLGVTDGKLQVTYKNSQPVPVDTSTLRVTVFTDVFADDMRYLQAAVQSIQQVEGREIILKTVTKTLDVPSQQDWLFWLSEKPVPVSVHAKRLFEYAQGKPVAVESRVQEKNIDRQGTSELYRRVPYVAGKNISAIWRDGFGSPLLTRETIRGDYIYRYYTHFNPSWNELVWSASFPQVIYQWFNEDAADISQTNDQRVIDDSQLQPQVARGNNKTTASATADTRDTEHVVWAFIFILFAVERFFSFRIKAVKTNA